MDLEQFASWGVRPCLDQFETNPENGLPLITRPRKGRDRTVSPEDKPPQLTDGLHDFAHWAFGPDGFQSLRVLAFGDFSYSGRYRHGNVLLCKNLEQHRTCQGITGQNFRHLSKDDVLQWNYVEKYSNLLDACPTDLLFHTDYFTIP